MKVFRASGPTSGATIEVKLGAKKDGTIVAAKQVLKYQAGAFPGSPIGPGCMCGLAMYDIPNVDVVGYDVVSNRPKVAAYRAPGAPISSFAVESAVDDLARKLGMDPIALREQNGARNGTKTHYGPTHQNIGFLATLEAAKNHPHWKAPLKPGQGRGHRLRLLVQHRRRVLRGLPHRRGRHRGRHVRQSGHRRLARVDRHDGGGSAGRARRVGCARSSPTRRRSTSAS